MKKQILLVLILSLLSCGQKEKSKITYYNQELNWEITIEGDFHILVDKESSITEKNNKANITESKSERDSICNLLRFYDLSSGIKTSFSSTSQPFAKEKHEDWLRADSIRKESAINLSKAFKIDHQYTTSTEEIDGVLFHVQTIDAVENQTRIKTISYTAHINNYDLYIDITCDNENRMEEILNMLRKSKFH